MEGSETGRSGGTASLADLLQDDTFIEYFNSFLTLPIFSTKLCYNLFTEAFELVNQMRCSSRLSEAASTVYITDNDLSNEYLDSNDMFEWVAKNRFPLFLKSDLYSEYRLCKILTSSCQNFIDQFLLEAHKNGATTLSKKRTISVTECSNPHLGSRLKSANKSRYSSRAHSARISYNMRAKSTDSAAARAYEITSMSGMRKFRCFLKGTTGEKTMLLWLDLQQIHNCTDEHERALIHKEIREKHVNAITSLTDIDESVTALEKTLQQRLTKYWYPRFLLHYLKTSPLSSNNTTTLPRINLNNQYKTGGDFLDHAPHPTKVHIPTVRRAPSRHGGSKPITRPQTQSTPTSRQNESLHKLRPSTTHVPIHPSRVTPHVAAGNTRIIWSRDSGRDSSTFFSQLAKFNEYPIISSTPGSRATSQITLEQYPSVFQLPTANDTQILSLSGTPLPLSSYKETHRLEYYLLMKCLTLERSKSGGYFHKFLQKMGNESGLRCLSFWEQVQTYKALFFEKVFNQVTVEMKSKAIYSLYILDTSINTINCPHRIQLSITDRLWPSYEDVFDEAEEYALCVLTDQWMNLCKFDKESFEQIKQHDTVDCPMNRLDKLSEESLSSFNGSVLSATSSVLVAEQSLICCEEEDILGQSSLMDKSSNDVLQEEKVKELNFNDILTDPKELEFFKIFLNENKGAVDLIFWMEVESFRGLSNTDRAIRNLKAKQIRTKYFNKEYFFGKNSPASLEMQREVVSAGGYHKLSARPKSPVFIEAQKHVRSCLEKKWVPLYLKSDGYLQRHKAVDDTDNTSELETITDYTESHETLELKRTLYNKAKCQQFKEFLNIQASEGTNPSSNVDFWLEIQRLKEMFHYQMNSSTISEKIKAILSCFVQSSITPRTQINIPSSVADNLLTKKHGPYMFREAQAVVFLYLQTQWQDFQSFLEENRHKGTTEKCLKDLKETIDRQRESEYEAMKLKQMAESDMLTSGFRFETKEEKEMRISKEKNEKDLGKIGVSFRLSNLDPSVTYCGTITSLNHQLKTDKTHHQHSLMLNNDSYCRATKSGHVRFQSPITMETNKVH